MDGAPLLATGEVRMAVRNVPPSMSFARAYSRNTSSAHGTITGSASWTLCITDAAHTRRTSLAASGLTKSTTGFVKGGDEW